MKTPIHDIQKAVEAYQRHGSLRKAAAELGVHHKRISKRLRIAEQNFVATEQEQLKKIDLEDQGNTRVVSGKGFKSVEGLLEAAGIKENSGWVVTKQLINSWEALAKDNKIVQLWQTKAWLERSPSFYLKEISCNPLPRQRSSKQQALKSCLVIPDSQHGFRRSADGKLEPIHDREAVDVVLQIARQLSKSLESIVLLGDMLDLSPFSRWTQEPELRFCTQPALVELHWMIAQLRLAAPHATIHYLEGNHEIRIEKQLKELAAGELLSVKRVDELNANPLLSIPSLLALDKLDCEYVAPYGKPFWWRGVKFVHGTLARPRGKTAAAYLANATSSMVWGHVHRLELAMRTIDTAKGAKQITALSPGCLCRIDGAVPHSAGVDQLDWQQGCAVIWNDGKQNQFELVQIVEGQAVLHGVPIYGDSRVDEISRSTGFDF